MISKKTKYGLKALTYLARQDNKQPVQIGVISKSENISQKVFGKYFTNAKKKWLFGF